jgi:hypothetical protein
LCPADADRVACDDRTDCSDLGQICCATDTATGGSTAVCQLPAQCTGLMRRTQFLCDPNQMGTCLGGPMACRTDQQDIIPAYAYCH